MASIFPKRSLTSCRLLTPKPGGVKSSITKNCSLTCTSHLPSELIYERELLICRL